MNQGPGRTEGWRYGRNWRERLQSQNNLSGFKLILAWFVLGLLMIIGFFVGLIFLLLGWILMPLLRYGWVKRARRQGQDRRGTGSQYDQGRQARPSEARVIEGEYQIRKPDSSE